MARPLKRSINLQTPTKLLYPHVWRYIGSLSRKEPPSPTRLYGGRLSRVACATTTLTSNHSRSLPSSYIPTCIAIHPEVAGRSLKLYQTIRWHVNGGRLSHFACGGDNVNSRTLRRHDQTLRLPRHKPPNQAPIPACIEMQPQIQMNRNLKLQHYQTIRWHVNDGCLVSVVCLTISPASRGKLQAR